LDRQYYYLLVGLINIAIVILFTGIGGLVGWTSSRLKRGFWLLGYVLPLLLLLAIGFGRRFPVLDFVAPFRWLTYGRMEFALLGPIITCLFASLFSRLAGRRIKILLAILVVAVVLSQSVAPFAVPLFMVGKLESLETTLDKNDVCLQSTGYTCGPAAAVSALGQFGIEADEGQIALRAFTTTSGTDPDLLCRTINDMYADQGITAAYRPFKFIDELKDAGVTIVVIKHSFLIDHYVTVLDVTDDEIVTADSLVGRYSMSHSHFLTIWRSTGIVIQKN